MAKHFKVGEVVEWRQLDAGGNPVGEPLVVRYAEEGKVVGQPRSEPGGSISPREERGLMETTVDPAAGKRNPEQPSVQPGFRPSVAGPLLKTEEAAKYLAISPRQVQYLSDRGELPCIKMATSTRYSPADLDEFIDQCRRKGGRS